MFEARRQPCRCHPNDLASDSTQMKAYPKPPIKTNSLSTNYPIKPCPSLPKDLNTQPSATFPNSSYTNQPQCPLQQRDPARMAETPAPPKPTEVTSASHPRGCSHQYKMFRATLSSTRSRCKIGTRVGPLHSHLVREQPKTLPELYK
jgi:hypothetical protein